MKLQAKTTSNEIASQNRKSKLQAKTAAKMTNQNEIKNCKSKLSKIRKV
jgi:hypothetical protein